MGGGCCASKTTCYCEYYSRATLKTRPRMWEEAPAFAERAKGPNPSVPEPKPGIRDQGPGSGPLAPRAQAKEKVVVLGARVTDLRERLDKAQAEKAARALAFVVAKEHRPFAPAHAAAPGAGATKLNAQMAPANGPCSESSDLGRVHSVACRIFYESHPGLKPGGVTV